MTASTIRLGLIGDNIDASKAPALHEIAGDLCGLTVTYDRLKPKALGRSFETLLLECAAQYHGLNITYPYKERAFALAEVAEPSIRAIGAVNTVLLNGAVPAGFNTDYSGFIAAYRHTFGDALPGVVAMAGAGGVGRAVGFALAELGARTLRLFDLDGAKSAALAGAIRAAHPQTFIQIANTIELAMAESDALVNCTPLGMVDIGGCPFPPALISTQNWAFDAIYTPVDTPFMLAARKAGLATMSGYELFFYQGVHAFRLFAGQDVPEEPLRWALSERRDAE